MPKVKTKRSPAPKTGNSKEKIATMIRLAIKGSKLGLKTARNALNDPDFEVRRIAARTLASLGEPSAELYGKHLADKRFNSKKLLFVRRMQEKPERNTLLAGGRLKGKAVMKLMSDQNAKAWLKALKLGIPAEPILKRKNGKYRIFKRPDGSFEIVAGVLKGFSVGAFLMNSRNKRFEAQIRMQMEKIKEMLEQAGIRHGHIHDLNFVVVPERKGSKICHKVFVVDFDKASLI